MFWQGKKEVVGRSIEGWKGKGKLTFLFWNIREALVIHPLIKPKEEYQEKDNCRKGGAA